MVLTRRRAQGILSAAMDGQRPAGLDDALQLLNVAHTEFDRCCSAARAVTVPMNARHALVSSDLQSRHISGLDSDVDYDAFGDAPDLGAAASL